VLCFNTFTAIVIMHEPERSANPLAYSSIIIKASIDYDDMARVRRAVLQQVATKPKEPWAQLDAALWTVYFTPPVLGLLLRL
jgi:hypothetical protein